MVCVIASTNEFIKVTSGGFPNFPSQPLPPPPRSMKPEMVNCVTVWTAWKILVRFVTCNPWQSSPSLNVFFCFGLLVPFECFSTLANYHLEVSRTLKLILHLVKTYYSIRLTYRSEDSHKWFSRWAFFQLRLLKLLIIFFSKMFYMLWFTDILYKGYVTCKDYT